MAGFLDSQTVSGSGTVRDQIDAALDQGAAPEEVASLFQGQQEARDYALRNQGLSADAPAEVPLDPPSEPLPDPFAQFAQQSGQAPAETDPFAQFAGQPSESAGEGSYAKDMLAAWGIGSNMVLETAGNLYGLISGNMDNWAARQGQSGQEFYRGMRSSGYEQAERDIAEAVENVDGEVLGVPVGESLDEFATEVWETLKNPKYLGLMFTEQLPMLVAPGGAGAAAGRALGARAGVAAGVGAGAAMHGSDVGGQTYQDLMSLPEAFWEKNEEYAGMVRDGIDPEIAKDSIAKNLARQAAVASGAGSVATNMLPFARTFERAAARVPGAGTVVGRAARGAVGEGLQEVAEEGSGQIISNVAVGQVDPTRDISEGVGSAAGQALLAGGAFGAIAGAASPSTAADPEVSDADAMAEVERLRKEDEARQIEQDEREAEQADLADRRARGAVADAAAARAAAEVEASGGDSLAALNAATKAYNETHEMQEAARQLDSLQSGSIADTMAVDQDATARRDNPLTIEIQRAEQAGREEDAVRLANAQRMYDTATRFQSENRLRQSDNFRRRADNIVRSVLGRDIPQGAVLEGELQQAEQVAPQIPMREPQTFNQPRQPQPALPRGGEVIYGPDADRAARDFRAAERESRNDLALEGTFEPGRPPMPAAPLQEFGSELPAETIDLSSPVTEDQIVDDSDYPPVEGADVAEEITDADYVDLSNVDFNDPMQAARANREMTEILRPAESAVAQDNVDMGDGRVIEKGAPVAAEVRRTQKRLQVMDSLLRCLG